MRGKAKGVGHTSGAAGALPECEVKTLITSPSWCAALGRLESKLVGILWKALAWDATRRLRLDVNAAGWLHSLVLHGCTAVADDEEK